MPNRLRVWENVAAEFGGVAVVETYSSSSVFRLSFRLEHTGVVVIGRNYPYGTTSYRGLTDTMLASAGAAGTEGMSLDIRSDRPSLWSGLLGWDELTDTGNAAFDRRFRVMSNDRGWARTWLSERARHGLLQIPSCKLKLRRGRVELSSRGDFAHREEDLRRYAETVAALSSMRALELKLEWEQLAAALEGRLESQTSDLRAARLIRISRSRPPFELASPPIIELRRASQVLRLGAGLRSKRKDRWLATVLSGKRPHESGRLLLCGAGAKVGQLVPWKDSSVRIDELGALAIGRPREFVALCIQRLMPVLSELGDDVCILVDRKVEVLWPGLETRAQRIEVGAAAAVLLGGDREGVAGPYR